jgi:CRP/FNR family transcriptional activator FtrB
MTAQTLTRSDIMIISGDALRGAMRADAAFGCAVAAELAGCHQGLVRAIKNQKLRGGAERLANYLITQRARQGRGATIVLPHVKRVLASLLGMTPESLSRAFAVLADYGVIVRGPEVTIRRPLVLERLAKPDPLIDNHHPNDLGVISKADRERAPTIITLDAVP